MKFLNFITLFCLVAASQVHCQNTLTEPAQNSSNPTGCTHFESTPHVAQATDDLLHPCFRSCNERTTRKQCYYQFKAEWYITMSKACYDCPFNITDCLRPHCVVGDGFERAIVTVNRRLPGPSIQVCEGDEVIVDVINELMSDSTTIHWHGLHMKGTPYMDGVPFLTQCPIHPGTSFRYHFLADLAGTHYWHSHSAFQRTDGMFGSIVVRAKVDPHANLYDVDDPEHVMLLTDWMDKLGIDKFVNHHHTKHENKPYNILVNGLGKHVPLEKDNICAYSPLYEFKVKKNLRYRFRSISNSIQNCPIEISVDNHTLLVIASDAHNIEPVEVNSLVIYAGERWDFVINANQTSGIYWVKYRGLLDCDARFLSAHQVAVLRYEGATGCAGPAKNVTYDFTKREGFQLNTLNAAPGDLRTFLTAADIRSYNLIADPSPYARTPDYKFWLDFDFYGKDNELFHHPEHYPFYGVDKSLRLYVPQVNNISLRFPNVPPLSQPEELDSHLFCNSTLQANCSAEFCFCTHTLNVKLGSLVELILIDTGVVYYANHPFHMHGHAFAVLGMARFGENTTLHAIQDLEKNGMLIRNLDEPPIKDSVTVPDGGYTIVRFIASNPGYWLFHCHLSFHVETGMGLIFHVGETEDLPPVPPKFPTCGSWLPTPVADLALQINAKNNLSG